MFYHPDIAYQMWQKLNLVKEANSGNALAMHELGIRYILGDGVPADTEKAAYWIGKAAERGLTGACYNFAILLNNGWGIKWNPFTAYDYFMKAAQNSMPQAEYFIGMMYTDNLIVKRNWGKAYLWIKKASDDGFSPAKEVLTDLKSRIDFTKIDTSEAIIDSQVNNNSAGNSTPDQSDNSQKSSSGNSNKNISSAGIAPNLGFVFIDFNLVRDTTSRIPDRLLVEDLFHQGNDSLVKKIKINIKNDSLITIDTASINILKKFADAGSPEALTLLGRLYQTGQFFKKDLVEAAVYYIRAMKLDSPRAPLLLWHTLKENNFYDKLKPLTDQNDPRAMFIWYGLFSTGMDNQIVEQDAIKLLEKAAELHYLPAMNELGLDYYTGKYIKRDMSKALSIWKIASNSGSKEAELRLSISKIYGADDTAEYITAVDSIKNAVKAGSVLAQATLAYCFQNGIGVDKNLPNAVEYYRFAAQRGSQFAYNRLKQLYDSLRPEKKEFRLN